MSFGVLVVVPIVAVVVMMRHDSKEAKVGLDIRVQEIMLYRVDFLLFGTAKVRVLHGVAGWKKLESDDLETIETRMSRLYPAIQVLIS